MGSLEKCVPQGLKLAVVSGFQGLAKARPSTNGSASTFYYSKQFGVA